MPRRKQRKIHAPLKQDIQMYREMQKDRSPFRSTSPIALISTIQTEELNPISPLPFTTLSEETLSELGITSAYKKPRDKTKNLEPSYKKPRLEDEATNLNLVTPGYLNISEQEFRSILNTPERIFTLVQDEALGSDEWKLDDYLIDMTDEEFECLIENPDNLEDIWNSKLEEKEKLEQEVKKTIFTFLLETENELKNIEEENIRTLEEPSTSSENINDDVVHNEKLLETKRNKLKDKRIIQKRERELLEKLEKDLEILKEKEGTREFNSKLYDQIENEINLKRKQIKSKYHSKFKYDNSEKGKARKRKYEESEKGKNTKRNYNQSERGKEVRKKYEESEKGKETIRRYEESENRKELHKKYRYSEKGKETQKRYLESEKGKETQKRYLESEKCKESKKRYYESEKGKEYYKKHEEKRKQKRLEEKLRAEMDPELKKILEEKKRIKNERDRIRYQKKKLEKLLSSNNQNI